MTGQDVKTLIETKTSSILANLYTTDDVTNHFNDNFIKLFVSKHNEFSTTQVLDFFHKAQLTGADPRKDQVYLVGFKSNNKMVHTIVFSYHFLLAQANKTGELGTVSCITETREVFNPVTCEESKQLVAVAKVFRKGNPEPTIFEAFWSEFVKTKYDGTVVKSWADKPRVMLQKCAVANALRWAFPEALSGVFIQEEMKGAETSEENELTKQDKADSIDAEFSEPNQNDLNINITDVKTRSEQKTSFTI